MNKITVTATLIIIMMLPLGAYAGAADDIGDGISDIVGGVGEAVKDVGKGVGDGVSDIGNGIGDAFSGDNDKSAVTSDTDVTDAVHSSIKKLSADNQIKPGYNLHVATVNGVVVISGEVTEAADVSTIRNAVLIVPGVKSVNTQNIKVK